MRDTGKLLAGWSKDGKETETTAGCPPKLDASKWSTTQMSNFVDSLLGHNQHVSRKVKYFLVANGLRFLNQFTEFMNLELSGKFKCKGDLIAKNTFYNRVSKKILNYFYNLFENCVWKFFHKKS